MQKTHLLFGALLIVVAVQSVIIFGQLYAPSGQKAAAQKAAAQKSSPATLEPVQGSEIKRVRLTAKAAERLGIQTAVVREQEVVRKRKFVGTIVAAAPAGGAATLAGHTTQNAVVVRVPATDDLKDAVLDGSALVMPLVGNGKVPGLTAKRVEVSAGAKSDAVKAVYYLVDGAKPGPSPGQRMTVELHLNGSGTTRTVIPYSAALYDEHGKAWVFTNPAPLVFVRHPIIIDYFERDLAVLSKGPPAGAAIVTVGASQLFGAETGIGH